MQRIAGYRGGRIMRSVPESMVQEQLAHYIRMEYPDVLFHSDFGSGVKLTPAQAIRQKKVNGGLRAWPDIFIAESAPRCVDGSWNYEYHGLMIELKRDGTKLKKKNGEWSSEHIEEQALVLEKLRDKGYRAEFAIGFDEAKKLVDEYLGGVKW